MELNYSIEVEDKVEEESRKRTAYNKTGLRMSTEILSFI
jgi:hypothetical protein